MFYKAGDNGDYDLYFHPEDLALPGAGFDAQALRLACAGFSDAYAAMSVDLGLTRAIRECEAMHLADSALRQLEQGASLQEVGESLFGYLAEDALVPRVLGRRV